MMASDWVSDCVAVDEHRHQALRVERDGTRGERCALACRRRSTAAVS